jgi:LacI family transcriptional regulator
MVKRVTMQDIANELHISKNSVSQALTGKPGVSEETRKKVQEVADRLGYRYNTPKVDQLGKNGQIGLIASESVMEENVFFGSIYVSIQKQITNKGFNLVVHAVDKESEEYLKLPSFIEEKQVDGLVILSHLNHEYIQTVLKSNLPTVLVDHHHPSLSVDSVLTNNRFGAYLATNHLIQLGHKHIGFIGDVFRSPSYQERYEGYCLALQEHGLVIDQRHVVFHPVQTTEFMVNFLNSCSSFPTAWFCANDTIGFHLINGLQRIGAKIPEDISVCGFDNHLVSELCTPVLTTMHVYKDYFGQRAVDRLLWRMENKGAFPEELILPVKLIERASTSFAKN